MKKYLPRSISLLNKRIRVIYVLIFVFLSGSVAMLAEEYMFEELAFHEIKEIPPASNCPPQYLTRIRANGYTYAHPLLLVDRNEESKELMQLKGDLSSIISQMKDAGMVYSASVYLRKMEDFQWLSLNADEQYNPGSLIKVAVLLTYLYESESTPGLLNKKLKLSHPVMVPSQTFKENRIESGKEYTIRELLYYMIVKSDNFATLVLNENMNIKTFKKLFTDLGMAEPDLHDPNFLISAVEYAKFFRILYNSTYLNFENSEYALSLLSQSPFKYGIASQLPPGIVLAGKFGEWTGSKNSETHQLHDAGIVFYGKNPILIVIMTKGPDVNLLPKVIGEITRVIVTKLAIKGTNS